MLGTFAWGELSVETDRTRTLTLLEDGVGHYESLGGCGDSVLEDLSLTWEPSGDDAIRIFVVQPADDPELRWTLRNQVDCTEKRLLKGGSTTAPELSITEHIGSSELVGSILRGEYCLVSDLDDAERDEDGNLPHGMLYCHLEPCGETVPTCDSAP